LKILQVKYILFQRNAVSLMAQAGSKRNKILEGANTMKGEGV
jgi:hypothetical protein